MKFRIFIRFHVGCLLRACRDFCPGRMGCVSGGGGGRGGGRGRCRKVHFVGWGEGGCRKVHLKALTLSADDIFGCISSFLLHFLFLFFYFYFFFLEVGIRHFMQTVYLEAPYSSKIDILLSKNGLIN